MNKSLSDISRGFVNGSIPFVTAYCTVSEQVSMPDKGLYIYIVADGSMRLHTPSGIMDYAAGQYSVSAIDTPFAGEVLAFSEHDDFVSLSIEITPDEVISVILETDGDMIEKILRSELPDDVLSQADEQVVDSVIRLLRLSGKKEFLAFMGNQLKREIIFYALCGSCGKQFIQSIVNISGADDIYEINRWIKENYKTAFTVDELARNSNMSTSHFHQKFKSAVGMGPLQCQKRLRLTEARRLMLNENMSVTEAALEVGYESLSQFIRDYKKMFYAPPKEDIRTLKLKSKKRGSDTHSV